MLFEKLVPVITPETQKFWEGLVDHKLLLCRCTRCRKWTFPPSNVCPGCGSDQTEWTPASGRGSLYSYTLNYKPAPMWGNSVPMSVALVELDEGPQLISTIVGCRQTSDELVIGMRLSAKYVPTAGITMLCFSRDPEHG